jgi:hypothetical protein
MLNSLAAQLGKPEPDAASLSNQVLGALLRRRIEELKDGQSRLNDRRAEIDNDENYSEWRPFFDSLRVALESEQRQLQTTQRAQ